VAAGIPGAYDAASVYQHLLTDMPRLCADSLRHYLDLDSQGTEFLTPDPAANRALRWARVALDQLKICNPELGCGYVADICPSGSGCRPNYAWFFQDALVTAPAYLEYGGSESVREILQFSQKHQLADGKIAHEVAQSAGFIDWFKGHTWPYIHADAPMN
jgi:glycogen debranching enzyme